MKETISLSYALGNELTPEAAFEAIAKHEHAKNGLRTPCSIKLVGVYISKEWPAGVGVQAEFDLARNDLEDAITKYIAVAGEPERLTASYHASRAKIGGGTFTNYSMDEVRRIIGYVRNRRL